MDGGQQPWLSSSAVLPWEPPWVPAPQGFRRQPKRPGTQLPWSGRGPQAGANRGSPSGDCHGGWACQRHPPRPRSSPSCHPDWVPEPNAQPPSVWGQASPLPLPGLWSPLGSGHLVPHCRRNKQTGTRPPALAVFTCGHCRTRWLPGHRLSWGREGPCSPGDTPVGPSHPKAPPLPRQDGPPHQVTHLAP